MLDLATIMLLTCPSAAGKAWVQDELGSLIPGLVHLASESDKAAVRRAALDTLAAVTVLPYETLHPYKRDVMRCLGKALDDHKRMVRVAAVQCREKWTTDGK